MPTVPRHNARYVFLASDNNYLKTHKIRSNHEDITSLALFVLPIPVLNSNSSHLAPSWICLHFKIAIVFSDYKRVYCTYLI